MTRLCIRPTALGATSVTHEPSGAVVLTERPPEFGGRGHAFSATDLLAAALGACIATTIDAIALRHGVPPTALEVWVDKRLDVSARRLEALDVTILVRTTPPPEVLALLKRAACRCVVHRALHPSVPIETRVYATGYVVP
jgi:uncharacterized OsmC-like protein